MSKKGKFIVIEGIEGAGKSTAIQTIKNFLEPHVGELIITREPGGTLLGESLRNILKEGFPEEPIHPLSELLLIYAARIQLVEQVIKPALNQGKWVLSDRFELSSFAYQGGGRALGLQPLLQLSELTLKGFAPDLIIFLDISPEIGLERAKQRGAYDRFEQETTSFFHAVYNTYQQIINTLPYVKRINAEQELKQVQYDIISVLKGFI